MTEVRRASLDYSEEKILIENTGNVPFIDEIVFILKNNFKSLSLKKEIEIEPGKTFSLDLSKEVPGGVYDILVPVREGLIALKNAGLQNIGELSEEIIKGS